MITIIIITTMVNMLMITELTPMEATIITMIMVRSMHTVVMNTIMRLLINMNIIRMMKRNTLTTTTKKLMIIIITMLIEFRWKN